MDIEQKEDNIDFSSMLASTVHDMKGSLTMLLNTLDEIIVDTKNTNLNIYAQFSKLQYEAKRVNNNLIQLLTIYKMEKSQYNVNIEHYSVSDFLDEQILQSKSLFEFHNITVSLDCHSDLYWYFDRDLLSGVINNVINNIIRYTKDKFSLKAYVADNCLHIELHDNGRGYPKTFATTDSVSHKRVSFATGSTGLGLYFSSLVARAHRNKNETGSIMVNNNSEFGGGLFTIILP
ncbi:MAG: HAMP domain-containing histidine kinase [Nitrospirae bacterium]|nr:HAMP domain-containing histidine kinase [Nitrospirota bacterium]